MSVINVKNSKLFIEGSFRTIDISQEQKIKAVVGKLIEGDDSMVLHAYIFDKDAWSEADAVKWVDEHKKYALNSLLVLYKEMPLGEEVKKVVKYYTSLTKSVDETAKSVWAVVTTDGVDRDNEINTKDSWTKRIGEFMKHPVLLSSHNYSSIQSQIGEVVGYKMTDEGMAMNIKYYVGEGNAEADWSWVLASKGKAMYSVGYIPHQVLDGENIPKEYADKNAKRVFTDNELLEVSQVVVGSNRGALQLGISNPTIEQCQYVFDIAKSFGNDIPDFSKKKDVAPKKEEPKQEDKPTKDSFILNPVEISKMEDFQKAMEIWKSGRVISTKNKETLTQTKQSLQDAISSLESATEMIDNLLSLTDQSSSEGGEKETDSAEDVDQLLKSIKELQNKLKSN